MLQITWIVEFVYVLEGNLRFSGKSVACDLIVRFGREVDKKNCMIPSELTTVALRNHQEAVKTWEKSASLFA